jgi:hypothetical protein
MFSKILSVLALLVYGSELASAAYSVKIGYLATLVPGLPGPEPSDGCGLWAQLSDGSSTSLPDCTNNPDDLPTDDCPAAEIALFCSRWGCPFPMTFNGGAIAVTVESEISDDMSISASASDSSGARVTVTCPWSPETISENDSEQTVSSWSYDFSSLG